MGHWPIESSNLSLSATLPQGRVWRMSEHPAKPVPREYDWPRSSTVSEAGLSSRVPDAARAGDKEFTKRFCVWPLETR